MRLLRPSFGAAVLLVVGIALGGCQTDGTPQVVNFAAPVIPKAQPLHLSDVHWKVYTVKELKQVVADAEKHPDKNIVIYGLTSQGYKNLSTNMADIERYIKEQGSINLYLQNTLKARENVGKPSS
jgi:hypothetical protein